LIIENASISLFYVFFEVSIYHDWRFVRVIHSEIKTFGLGFVETRVHAVLWLGCWFLVRIEIPNLQHLQTPI